jgi:hypothetical protein
MSFKQRCHAALKSRILVRAFGILHSNRGFRGVFVLKSRTEFRGPEATWNRFSGSCSRGLRRDTAGAGKAQLEVLHSNDVRTFSETSFAI